MKITKLLFLSLFAVLNTNAALSTNGTGFVTNFSSQVFYIGPGEILPPYANLSYVDLSGADLSGATLSNTWLSSANLTGANFTNATLSGIRSGRIIGIPAALPPDWQLLNGYLVGPTANLNDALLGGVDLSSADLTGVNIKNADLSGAILSNVNFSGATDMRADFSGADLYGANLDGAALEGAILDGVASGSITGTVAALPAGWLLTHGFLIGAGANLSGANLQGVDLSQANLTGVQSGGITGTPSDFPADWQLFNGYLIGPGADLSGADLSGADLTGLDLSNIILTDANLAGADVSGTWLDFQSKSELDLVAAYEAELATNYTLAEISDLRPGSSLIAVSNGTATIRFTIDVSTNLVDWTPATNTTSATLPADPEVQFFRFRM
ncbi:pentapeptide repeat-containing protein [Pontiellaceae bacterium B12227]|nr:pentapeptide repeat-containing protein [Pontiellaceae bacterium B12227]